MKWIDKLFGRSPDKGGRSTTPPMQPQKPKYTPKKTAKPPKRGKK